MRDSKTTPWRRQFYWSGRTLRVEIWDDEDGPPRDEDVIGVDHMRCVGPVSSYGEAIVGLLNQHFGLNVRDEHND